MSTLMLGYLDADNSFLVPPILRMAECFHGGVGLAAPFGETRFGFVNAQGDWVLEPVAHWSGAKQNGVTLFNVDGKRGERGGIVGGLWGWAGDGRLLCEAKWRDAKAFADGLLPVYDGAKWGYADKNGTLVIPCRFEWAGSFSDGAAIAVENGKDCYLKPDGSVLLGPVEGELWAFAEARGRVKRGDGWRVISPEGRELTGPYDEIWSHRGGMAKVKAGERFAFVDLDGQLIGDEWFDETQSWHGGQAPVRKGDEWFVLEANGTLHGPFLNCTAATEGITRVVTDAGIGFLVDGEPLNDWYDSAMGFTHGRAGVCREGKWTFIDRTGRQQGPFQWDDVGQYTKDGTVRTKKGIRWGVLDGDGQVLIPHKYTTMGDFSDGLAPARRVRWDGEISPPPAGVTTMPPGGLKHPVFAQTGAGDDLRIHVCFEPVLEESQVVKVRQLVWALRDTLDQRAHGDGSLYKKTFWLTDYALSLRLRNLDHPVKAADLLLDELQTLDLPIKELTFMLLREDPDVPMKWNMMFEVKSAAPHPDDPRGPNAFPDFPTYWRRVWDFDQVAPRSENLFYLKICRFDREMNFLFAERLMSVHLPGIRVCMGTMQESSSYDNREDARKAAVERAVVERLAQHLSADRLWIPPFKQPYSPPTPGKHDWSVGIETVNHEGRKGYSFAIDPPAIIQDVGPDIYRYREQEVLDALGDVVRDLNLAPVILWQLFSEPLHQNMPHIAGTPPPSKPNYYIFQLWER